MEAFVITPLLVLNPTVDTRACRGGWRDVMINFCITKDDGLHICELQIAHKQMMTARKGLPGHAVYNRVRDALARTVSPIQLHALVLTLHVYHHASPANHLNPLLPSSSPAPISLYWHGRPVQHPHSRCVRVSLRLRLRL